MNSFKNISFIAIQFLLLAFFANVNVSAQTLSPSDTIRLSEIELDSIRFYLREDLTNLENTLNGTAYINIDDKVYLLPYKITARTSVDIRRQPKLFKLSGISLSENEELSGYVTDMFVNPREKLRERISARNWKKSSVYLTYFAQYDRNTSGKEQTETVDEFKEFSAEGDGGFVEQNYTDFPLPQTIDIEVDLTKTPRTVTILGLEFDFDRLDKRFQRLLLDFGDTKEERNRKSYNIIK